MTPAPIWTLLSVPVTALVARILLTLPQWSSGIEKIIDFPGGVAALQQAGFNPPAVICAAVIVTQLVGSALVIANRWAWLGAGMLAVFTALTVFLVHNWWSMPPGPERVEAYYTALMHVGHIGGLILAAVLSVQARRVSRYA
jgi:transmembrane protein